MAGLVFGVLRYMHADLVGTRHYLASEVLDERRAFWVSLPESYQDAINQRYPVLFVLDAGPGSRVDRIVKNAVHELADFGRFRIPEMIVVGIESNTGERTRDFTPTHSLTTPEGGENPNFASSGGGDAFLAFIEQELIPHIDQHYRTLAHRTLFGHSFGGLFAVHAMQRSPTLFQALILSDPALWWDDHILQERLNQTPFERLPLIHLAESDSVMIFGPDNSFTQAISGFRAWSEVGYPGRVSYQKYPQQMHHSLPLRAFLDGIESLFQGYAPSLDELKQGRDYLDEKYAMLGRRLGVTLKPSLPMLDFYGGVLFYMLGEQQAGLAVYRLATLYYPQAHSAKEQLEIAEQEMRLASP